MLKNRNGRGFSLIESGVVMVMLSLIGMVTMPAVKESRSQMRGVSLGGLKAAGLITTELGRIGA